MIKVIYDGQCGLCSREIEYYKTISPQDRFEWLNIKNLSNTFFKDLNLTRVEALKTLHAYDDSGQIHKGADAFILIWKQLKYWRFLGLFVSLPIIRQVAKIAYRLFANWKFKHAPHCQIALKEEG
jgi:predicted DCC family thiol-disulfide oxidoreductase YuxK